MCSKKFLLIKDSIRNFRFQKKVLIKHKAESTEEINSKAIHSAANFTAFPFIYLVNMLNVEIALNI